MPLRRAIWQRLATDPLTVPFDYEDRLDTGLRPKLLAQVARVVPFTELPKIFPLMLQGKLRGRTVVSIQGHGAVVPALVL